MMIVLVHQFCLLFNNAVTYTSYKGTRIELHYNKSEVVLKELALIYFDVHLKNSAEVIKRKKLKLQVLWIIL
jgi:hypothetical protein